MTGTDLSAGRVVGLTACITASLMQSVTYATKMFPNLSLIHILMVSSEMPELLGVCDRILVMSGGKLAGEVDAKNTTQEEIMSLAAKYV